MHGPRQHHLLVGQNFLRQISSTKNAIHSVTELLNRTDHRSIPFALPCHSQSQPPPLKSEESRSKVVTFDVVPKNPSQHDEDDTSSELVALVTNEFSADKQSMLPTTDVELENVLYSLAETEAAATLTSTLATTSDMTLKLPKAKTESRFRSISARLKRYCSFDHTAHKRFAKSVDETGGAALVEKRRAWYLPSKKRSKASTHSLQTHTTTTTTVVVSPSGTATLIEDVSLEERSTSGGAAETASVVSKGELRFAHSLRRMNSDRADRARHTSSSSSEAHGLRPFELHDDEEISYRHLLVPYRLRASRVSPASRVASSRRHVSAGDEAQPPLTVTATTTTVDRPEVVSRSSSVEPQQQQHTVQRTRNEDSLSSTDAAGLLSVDTLMHSDGAAYLMYDMSILNNAEFGAAHHKTTLRFPGYVTTIIDYVDRADLKKEVNQKFRLRFPTVQLTHSKFRSLKREMRDIIEQEGIDLVTLAYAYVYFEKLVLKALVNKTNRKWVAGACLLLAAKMNDTRGQELTHLIEAVSTTFRCSSRELILMELPIAVALDFHLQIPDYEIHQHYQQLVSGISAES